MKQSTFITAGVLIGFILLYIYLMSHSPKPLDWSPTYNTKDKIPYGLYIMDQEIDSLFNYHVERSKGPLADYFYEGDFYDNDFYDQCILITRPHLVLDTNEMKYLCRFVSGGNVAFISAKTLPMALLDSLQVSINSIPKELDTTTYIVDIPDNEFDSTKIHIGSSRSYFNTFNIDNSQILGYLITKHGKRYPNFIMLPYGNGQFLIHVDPVVFTNYYLLSNKQNTYVESILSYIPSEFYISWFLHEQTAKVVSDSPLRFIMSQPPLKWAWFLIIIGLVSFVIFSIRRSQRAIKELPELTNTTVEFTRTISNLYIKEGSFNNLIDKKIIFILEKIRSEYNISTEILNDSFIQLLHLKTGKDKKIIKKLVFLIEKHKKFDYTCTEDDLKRINTTIENLIK